MLGAGGEVVGETASWLCIWMILLLKKDRNELHLLVVKEVEIVSMGLRSLLMID